MPKRMFFLMWRYSRRGIKCFDRFGNSINFLVRKFRIEREREHFLADLLGFGKGGRARVPEAPPFDALRASPGFEHHRFGIGRLGPGNERFDELVVVEMLFELVAA